MTIEVIVTDFKFAFWEQMKKVSPFSWFIFNLSKYLVSQLVCNSLQVSFYWPLYDIKPLGSRSIEEEGRPTTDMKRALSKLPFACGLEMKLHLSLSGSSKYKAALLYSHHSVVKSSKVFKKYSVHGSMTELPRCLYAHRNQRGHIMLSG